MLDFMRLSLASVCKELMMKSLRVSYSGGRLLYYTPCERDLGKYSRPQPRRRLLARSTLRIHERCVMPRCNSCAWFCHDAIQPQTLINKCTRSTNMRSATTLPSPSDSFRNQTTIYVLKITMFPKLAKSHVRRFVQLRRQRMTMMLGYTRPSLKGVRSQHGINTSSR
jgi:hypothetical protein